MVVFVNIATLFVLGSMIGYVLEIFYRRFVSAKKWVNPGFLIGPYIPIYGFGALILFGISCISIPIKHVPDWALYLIEILIIGISLTVIELIGGLIFIKGFHLKLWDYSKRWGNYQGIVCPLFSFIWMSVGSIYIFFIQPYLLIALDFFNNNLIYTFFIGIVVGMMLVDSAYSFHLGLKLRKVALDFNIRFEQLKIDAKSKRADISNKKPFISYFIDSLTLEELKELLNKSSKIEIVKRIKHKGKNKKEKEDITITIEDEKNNK